MKYAITSLEARCLCYVRIYGPVTYLQVCDRWGDLGDQLPSLIRLGLVRSEVGCWLDVTDKGRGVFYRIMKSKRKPPGLRPRQIQWADL